MAGELTPLPAGTVTAVGGGAAEVLTRAGRDADLPVVSIPGHENP